jgi:hypothetical protein
MQKAKAPPPSEPRWHASIAVLAAMALYITLPPRLTIGPIWVAPLTILLVLIPLSVIAPRRHVETGPIRIWSIGLIALVNFFNLASVLLLVAGFFHPDKASTHSAAIILRIGAQIWLTNILVFALWFWELDGGGPNARAQASAATQFHTADFLFPQMQMALAGGDTSPCIDPRWKPQFVDYLYVGFTNSTAFSPTDTMPLTPWAKMLMTVEAIISLMTIAIVFSRAVSLL